MILRASNLLCWVLFLTPVTPFLWQNNLTRAPDISPDTRITLRRYNCFFTCPDYLVTITGDGTVTFEGYANVRVKSKVTSTISREKVQTLTNAIAKARYFSLRDEYSSKEDGCRNVWADSNSVTVSVSMNGRTKSIDHYLGCHRHNKETSYPPALSKLEELIDELANTEQWIE